MKIDFVSPVPLFPTDGGNRSLILSQIMYLKELGHDVRFILLNSRRIGSFDESSHFSYLGDNYVIIHKRRLPEAVYLFRRVISIYLKKLKRLFGIQVFLHESVDDIFYLPFSVDLRRLWEIDPPNVCWVSYVYLSYAFESCPPGTLKVLETHDSFAHELPRLEERRGLVRADVVIAVQEQEAAYFKDLIDGNAPIVEVLSLMKEPSSRDVLSLSEQKCRGASFFGSSFAANAASLKFLVDCVLPEVLKLEPDFSIIVSGSVCKDIPDLPHVTKLWYVDDVDDAFRDAPILANSIVQGTGLKIKLIEALMRGVPVVSTKMGVRGLPVDILNGVFVVDDGDTIGFARALVRLYRDDNLRREMGSLAQRDAFRWNAAQKKKMQSILDIAGS